MKPLAVTPGEPAGIGPDILLQVALRHSDLPLVAIADQNLLQRRADLLNLNIKFATYIPLKPLAPNCLTVHHIPLREKEQPGKLNIANAAYVLECLRFATWGCLENNFKALVTGPVHKGIINDAGFAFSGHTEFLAELTNSPLPVMLMVAQNFKVALLTTHLALAAVPAAVTAARIIQTVEIIAKDLTQRFKIAAPRIAVCGLNPHAGENGYLGREEIEIITPALEQLLERGYKIHGPVSADTAFTEESLRHCDIILAMYHDQALPVVKTLDFDSAVNVTLGLPIIRTSVDHGTALELAGSGRAKEANFRSAAHMAELLSY